MEKIGQIEIRITGSKGNIPVSPDSYDIKEIISVLQNVESLLFPNEKKDRPTISYRIEEGSVKHVFKTSLQYVIGFNAILGQIVQTWSIDFLDYSTAKAFEQFQETALQRNYRFEIRTSVDKSNELDITKETRFFRTEVTWADAEFYFYGKITNMGGKEKANIHLLTDEDGTVIIQTPKEEIERIEQNPLYKTFGIRATGKQNVQTGEIDNHSIKFIEIVNYQPKYDESYLKALRANAMKNWLQDIDADSWLAELRGGYGR